MSNVIFLADAFSAAYLSPTVLERLKAHGYDHCLINQPDGYCERLPLISEGRRRIPKSSIGLKSFDRPPFAGVMDMVDTITRRKFFINRKIRGLVNRLFLQKKMKAYNIPLGFYLHFFLQEERVIDDVLQQQKRSDVNLDYFTNMRETAFKTDHDRLTGLGQALTKSTGLDQTYLLYYSQIDTLGHKFGPYSKQVEDAVLQCLDIFFDLSATHPEDRFYLVGDHGMAPVNQAFDFQAVLQSVLKNHYIRSVDYIYFCDSTFSRIWCKDDNIRTQIYHLLKGSAAITDAGTVDLVDSDQEYGDLRPYILFSGKPRTMIWPDFFHYPGTEMPKGMHGHLFSDDYLKGVFLDPETPSRLPEFINISTVISHIRARTDA